MLGSALSTAQAGMLQASQSVAARAEAIASPRPDPLVNSPDPGRPSAQPRAVSAGDRDTITAVTGLISDEAAFAANAAMARTADRMIGALLDIKA